MPRQVLPGLSAVIPGFHFTSPFCPTNHGSFSTNSYVKRSRAWLTVEAALRKGASGHGLNRSREAPNNPSLNIEPCSQPPVSNHVHPQFGSRSTLPQRRRRQLEAGFPSFGRVDPSYQHASLWAKGRMASAFHKTKRAQTLANLLSWTRGW
jgi:hypothetical protein